MSGNNGKSSSSSTLQLTMTADTNLSFEYKVSTEKNYDKLTITQGSKTLVNGVSGVIDWTRLEIDAKSDDVITIVYKKDSSGNKNDDCVYIRSFAAGAPTIITAPMKPPRRTYIAAKACSTPTRSPAKANCLPAGPPVQTAK